MIENGMVIGAQAEYDRREKADYILVALHEAKTDPVKFICDYVDDPGEVLSRVFKLCAENGEDFELIGRLISRTIFKPQIARASAVLADNE